MHNTTLHLLKVYVEHNSAIDFCLYPQAKVLPVGIHSCSGDASGSVPRLLHDLIRVENALSFWNHRLDKNEGHVRFLLLGQGPVAFAKAMQALVHKSSTELASSATSKIERRVCYASAHLWMLVTPVAHSMPAPAAAAAAAAAALQLICPTVHMFAWQS